MIFTIKNFPINKFSFFVYFLHLNFLHFSIGIKRLKKLNKLLEKDKQTSVAHHSLQAPS